MHKLMFPTLSTYLYQQWATESTRCLLMRWWLPHHWCGSLFSEAMYGDVHTPAIFTSNCHCCTTVEVNFISNLCHYNRDMYIVCMCVSLYFYQQIQPSAESAVSWCLANAQKTPRHTLTHIAIVCVLQLFLLLLSCLVMLTPSVSLHSVLTAWC